MRIDKATMKSRIVYCFVGIGTFLLGIFAEDYVRPPIEHLLKGPGKYKIYIVGDFKNNEDFSALQIKKVIEQEYKQDNTSFKLDGIDVVIDHGQSTEGTAKIDSAKLAKADDTLMVIGHFNSSATADALPNYLQALPPIPVILTNETYPRLLPQDYENTYYPVFRLSPTDENQAAIAAKFVHNSNAKAIWVVQDANWNPVYTNYLAQEFVKQVHLLPKLGTDQGRQPNKVLLWTINRVSVSTDAVKSLGIDWVFFVGHWSNCLIFTRQINEIWKGKPNKPKMLLSSSCAKREMFDQVTKGRDDMQGVYWTHQIKATDEGTTDVYGKLAFKLLEQLFQKANEKFDQQDSESGGPGYLAPWNYLRRLAGTHTVADARNALREVMKDAVTNSESFDLDGQLYKFKSDGTGTNTTFQVWQVGSDSTFRDVKIESTDAHAAND